MMTEDEAKTRQCCGPQLIAMMNAAIATRGEGMIASASVFCVGSACMAWRWARKPNEEWKPDHSMMWPPRDNRLGPQPYIEDRERGYCGLAGRPDA